MDDENKTYSATINVNVPFEFCKKCSRLKLDEFHAYLWGNGEPVWYEYSCEHGYFCKAIIDLYKASMEEVTNE